MLSMLRPTDVRWRITRVAELASASTILETKAVITLPCDARMLPNLSQTMCGTKAREHNASKRMSY